MEQVDEVTIFDISYDQNAALPESALAQGVPRALLPITIIAERFAGAHQSQSAHTGLATITCTGLLVDHFSVARPSRLGHHHWR
jgi:hypothetical protein